MKKKYLFLLILLLNSTSSLSAQEFTGDVKLACEAILCLSTGKRPNECTPSLRRYFSINLKHFSDTLKERRNFLNLCPAATVDTNMKKLVSDISNGAGYCDATSLNRSLTSIFNEVHFITSNRLPSVCENYRSNAYIDAKNPVTPVYVGEPENGGFWTEPENYDESVRIYNSRIKNIKRRVIPGWLLFNK